MKLRVTKNTQSPNGNFTLTLTGQDGLLGSLEMPLGVGDEFLIGQEFVITPGPRPVAAPPPPPPPPPPGPLHLSKPTDSEGLKAKGFTDAQIASMKK